MTHNETLTLRVNNKIKRRLEKIAKYDQAMERDYDRQIDSEKAHKACRAQIRKLLALANIQRKDDDFTKLVINYIYI